MWTIAEFAGDATLPCGAWPWPYMAVSRETRNARKALASLGQSPSHDQACLHSRITAKAYVWVWPALLGSGMDDVCG